MSRQKSVRIHPVLRWLALFGIAVIVFADCLPIATGPITVNGVVVGRGIVGSGAHSCKGSAGWDGVPAATFVPVGGVMDTHTPYLLVTGAPSGGNLGHLYVGVHVENAEKFSSGDQLTIFFDTDSNGSFDGKDFALHFEIGPGTPPSNEDCQGPPNKITMYTLSAGKWANPVDNPGGITAMTSWDYDNSAPDPEYQIWELEVDINLSTLGITIPAAGSKVGIGGVLYLNEPAMGGTSIAFAYPSSVTTDANPNDIDPNLLGVTAGNLAKYDVGSCGFDVTVDTTGSTDTKGSTNQFTRFPSTISGTLSGRQTNSFVTEIKFYDPGGSSGSVAAPNSGTMNFTLIPYGSGGPLESIPLGSFPAAFDHLNQIAVVSGDTLQWPRTEADYAPHRTTFANAGHTCVKVDVGGFTVDKIASNDSLQQNLTFTHLSTAKDSFHIRAPKEVRESYMDNGYIDFVLRPRWQNVPKTSMPPDPRTQPAGKFSYKFLNAGPLGLKYAGNGYWIIRLKPGEDKVVEVALTGGPMPYKVMQTHVPATAGGTLLAPSSGTNPVIVPVKEGMMVTLIANGLMSVDPNHTGYLQNTPEGFGYREKVRGTFLMDAKGAYVPWQNIGTLIGSFDKFKTSFRIGGSTGVVVPSGVTELFLAINDEAGKYGDNAGAGFDVNVVLSPATTLPTRIAKSGNALKLPDRVNLDAAMPHFNIDVMQWHKAQKGLVPDGYVTWAIYDSHP